MSASEMFGSLQGIPVYVNPLIGEGPNRNGRSYHVTRTANNTNIPGYIVVSDENEIKKIEELYNKQNVPISMSARVKESPMGEEEKSICKNEENLREKLESFLDGFGSHIICEAVGRMSDKEVDTMHQIVSERRMKETDRKNKECQIIDYSTKGC